MPDPGSVLITVWQALPFPRFEVASIHFSLAVNSLTALRMRDVRSELIFRYGCFCWVTPRRIIIDFGDWDFLKTTWRWFIVSRRFINPIPSSRNCCEYLMHIFTVIKQIENFVCCKACSAGDALEAYQVCFQSSRKFLVWNSDAFEITCWLCNFFRIVMNWTQQWLVD